MLNSDSYSINLKIHRLMGYLITITIIYLSVGFLLGYFFYMSSNSQYLLVLFVISTIYIATYTYIAIIFRRLIKDNKIKERTLMNYLVFSF